MAKSSEISPRRAGSLLILTHYIFIRVSLRKVRSHLGELARLSEPAHLHMNSPLMLCLRTKAVLLYSGIIQRTPYKADISLTRTVAQRTDMDLHSNSYIKICIKRTLIKANSNKASTFFVDQIKISPKATLCKANRGLKNNFHENSTHIFLLTLFLSTTRSSFYNTVKNFSYTFFVQLSAPHGLKTYAGPWVLVCIQFLNLYMLSNDFSLDDTVKKSKKELENVTRVFRDMPTSCPTMITARAYFFCIFP